MSMEHLGERISALVDGELGPAERDRALIHLASCDSCRFEADMLRRLKRRLHGLDAPDPSSDFLGRLSALGAGPPDRSSEPPGPGSGGLFGGPPPLGSSRPLGGPPPAGPAPGPAAAQPPARRPRRPLQAPSVLRPGWHRTRYAVAGVSALALTLGTAFVAGGDAEQAPVVRPSLEDYAVEHALTAGQAALPASEDGAEGARSAPGTPVGPVAHVPGTSGGDGTPRAW
uniref:anti-sigma factor family protein n=1 Tax=Nocardiopsis potens TaxID=1246458 RepID=UPI001C592786|nr:zf-HC2 domain-containing protein [Nocardiopsis potens]